MSANLDILMFVVTWFVYTLFHDYVYGNVIAYKTRKNAGE